MGNFLEWRAPRETKPSEIKPSGPLRPNHRALTVHVRASRRATNHGDRLDDALAIAAKFAGEELVIPIFKSRAHRRLDLELILKLRTRHRSIAAIARQVGCSERHVYNGLGRN